MKTVLRMGARPTGSIPAMRAISSPHAPAAFTTTLDLQRFVPGPYPPPSSGLLKGVHWRGDPDLGVPAAGAPAQRPDGWRPHPYRPRRAPTPPRPGFLAEETGQISRAWSESKSSTQAPDSLASTSHRSRASIWCPAPTNIPPRGDRNGSRPGRGGLSEKGAAGRGQGANSRRSVGLEK